MGLARICSGSITEFVCLRVSAAKRNASAEFKDQRSFTVCANNKPVVDFVNSDIVVLLSSVQC